MFQFHRKFYFYVYFSFSIFLVYFDGPEMPKEVGKYIFSDFAYRLKRKQYKVVYILQLYRRAHKHFIRSENLSLVCGNCLGETAFIQIWNVLLYLKLNFFSLISVNVVGFMIHSFFGNVVPQLRGKGSWFPLAFMSNCFGFKRMVVLCLWVTLMPIFLG